MFKPKEYLSSIFTVNLDKLKEKGYKGLLLDVDNTLKFHYSKELKTEIKEWLMVARKKGFKLCIVSNGAKKRIEEFAALINANVISYAKKPSKKGFVQGAEKIGLKTTDTVVIGDQILTDIWGGNRAGCYTILVKPLSKDEPWYIRYKRIFEFLALSGMKPQ